MTKNPAILERRLVPAGTLIVGQGEDGNSAYLIQSGAVIVYTEKGGKRRELARLKAGEIFGEMALISDEPRVASVQALEDTTLIGITRASFKDKLQRSDPTVKAIVEMLTKRMASTNTGEAAKNNPDAAMESMRTVCQDILKSLPHDRKDAFKRDVLPKLDDFFAALRKYMKI
ncbi:MAG: cyclic nucleotide-binding domain-containing protein [Alphaproteobacteria bacterium]|nr:cyclic nucleotide-binding domain-containing protein [Alphaproteobacteria bacterium]